MTAAATAHRTTETSVAVDLSAASRTFGTGDVAVQALKPIDLRIDAGQFVVLLGPSGSGKTTLLNIVGGIDPPSSGTVTVAGQEISGLDDGELAAFRRSTVGFVFQFFNLVPTLTARENVALIAELVGRADQSAALLDAVGLGGRLDHFPSSLSGGEQQRVAIARALAKEPEVLLCDEPTGSLDLETGRQALSLLRATSREEGRTVLLVTHNSAIARIADRIVTLHDGQIRTDEAVTNPIDPLEVDW